MLKVSAICPLGDTAGDSAKTNEKRTNPRMLPRASELRADTSEHLSILTGDLSGSRMVTRTLDAMETPLCRFHPSVSSDSQSHHLWNSIMLIKYHREPGVCAPKPGNSCLHQTPRRSAVWSHLIGKTHSTIDDITSLGPLIRMILQSPPYCLVDIIWDGDHWETNLATREMARFLRAIAALAEDPNSVLNYIAQFIATCGSSSSDAVPSYGL